MGLRYPPSLGKISSVLPPVSKLNNSVMSTKLFPANINLPCVIDSWIRIQEKWSPSSGNYNKSSGLILVQMPKC